MVIDFHTHTFPDSIAEKALKAMAKTAEREPRLNGTLSNLHKSMQKYGVAHSVMLPVATKESQVEMLNDKAAEMNKLVDITSFGAIHPEYFEWKYELKRIKKLGLKGIKIHNHYMRFFFDSNRCMDIVKEAFKNDLMVLVHAGDDPVSPDMNYCPPEMIKYCLPDLKGGVLIAAHYGGMHNLDRVEKYLVGEDVYIDTSMSHCFDTFEHCEHILQSHRSDRILFGSDSPWEDQGLGIDLIDKMNLPYDTKENIFYRNATRILDK